MERWNRGLLRWKYFHETVGVLVRTFTLELHGYFVEMNWMIFLASRITEYVPENDVPLSAVFTVRNVKKCFVGRFLPKRRSLKELVFTVTKFLLAIWTLKSLLISLGSTALGRPIVTLLILDSTIALWTNPVSQGTCVWYVWNQGV